MKCEAVEEVGKTHVGICDKEATALVEIAHHIGFTEPMLTRHNLCENHAKEYIKKYNCKET